MSESLSQQQQHRLDEYLAQLREYPWFTTSGLSMRNGPRAANLFEAHSGDWRPQLPAQARLKQQQWSVATEELEQHARASLGPGRLEQLLVQVRQEFGSPLWTALQTYLNRVSADGTAPDALGENAAVAVDAHQAILRDLSWAGVERVLGSEGYFCSLLPWYRDGRWPCGWTGQPAKSRPVIL